MRKQYKTKKRACGLCKPHKRGWAKRWKFGEILKAVFDDDMPESAARAMGVYRHNIDRSDSVRQKD